MRYCAHAALFWLLVFATFCGRRGCATKVVHVGPGQLHLCATAAEQAERDAQSTASEPEITRCVLAPGVYREALVYGGYAPLEIVGAGQGVTQLRGDEPLAGLSWAPSPDPETSIFSAGMPAGVLRTAGVQQAFFDDQWLPEARYPNANLNNILQLTSWGFCGKGSAHGYCKDRPDAWSALPRKNWTGALATLSLGTRIATWTRKVTSHGPGWFTYPASLGPGPGTRDNNKPGARYFLSGVLAALDSPGEFDLIAALQSLELLACIGATKTVGRASFFFACCIQSIVANETNFVTHDTDVQVNGLLTRKIGPSMSGPRTPNLLVTAFRFAYVTFVWILPTRRSSCRICRCTAVPSVCGIAPGVQLATSTSRTPRTTDIYTCVTRSRFIADHRQISR